MTPSFVAWRRYPGSRWFRIGEPQPTYAAAWLAALAIVRKDRQSGESTVIVEEAHPLDRSEKRGKPLGLFAAVR